MKNLDAVTDPQDVPTKGYIDGRVPQTTVSTTAPVTPAVNDIWINAS